MRAFLLMLILSIGSVNLRAQGTIRFSTKVDSLVDAPVLWPDGRGIGLLFTNIQAQLVLITGDGENRTFLPLLPTTTFSGTNQNLLDGRYVVEPAEPVFVHGMLPGQQATVFLRLAEDGFVVSWWQSAPITVTLGGTTPEGQVLPPALLTGLQGFTAGPLSPPSPFDWVIYFAEPGFARDDKFHVKVVSSFFPNYILESSTDFNAWVPVLTNRFIPFELELPFSRTNTQQVFFRLRTF